MPGGFPHPVDKVIHMWITLWITFGVGLFIFSSKDTHSQLRFDFFKNRSRLTNVIRKPRGLRVTEGVGFQWDFLSACIARTTTAR